MLDPIWDVQFAPDREARLRCARWALIIKSYKINRHWPDRPNEQIERTMQMREEWLDLVGHPPLDFALAYVEYLAWVISIQPLLGELSVMRTLYQDFKTGALPHA